MKSEMTIAEFKEARETLIKDIESSIALALEKFYERTGLNAEGEVVFSTNVVYNGLGEIYSIYPRACVKELVIDIEP